jgi:hypothetical protein
MLGECSVHRVAAAANNKAVHRQKRRVTHLGAEGAEVKAKEPVGWLCLTHGVGKISER